MEVQAEGCFPRPQQLLCLHGQLLLYDWNSNSPDDDCLQNHFQGKLTRSAVLHTDSNSIFHKCPPLPENFKSITTSALWLGRCRLDHARYSACHGSYVLQFEFIPRLFRTHHGAHWHHSPYACRHGGRRPKYFVEGR